MSPVNSSPLFYFPPSFRIPFLLLIHPIANRIPLSSSLSFTL